MVVASGGYHVVGNRKRLFTTNKGGRFLSVPEHEPFNHIPVNKILFLNGMEASSLNISQCDWTTKKLHCLVHQWFEFPSPKSQIQNDDLVLSGFQIYSMIPIVKGHPKILAPWLQEEMVHLNNVDRPGSDVDAYVNGLDRILRLKAWQTGKLGE